MEDIVIIGSGGHGREVAFLIERINKVDCKWNLLGYISLNDIGETKYGYNVLGDHSWFLKNSTVKNCIIAIGYPEVRLKVYNELSKYNLNFPNIIDPQAMVAEDVKMGCGNVIQGPGRLQVGVEVGSFCLLNGVCSIGHDAKIGSFVSMMPFTAISGNVEIGNNVLFGIGAKVVEKVKIGSNVTVGACSLVLDDIKDNTRVLGIPAKIK